MRKVIVLLLAVLLLGSLATASFAAPSSEAPVEFKIEIIYEFNPPEHGGVVVVKEGEEYTLVPKYRDGYEFDKYEIEGKYTIVKTDGDKLTIVAQGDLVVHVRYKGTPRVTVPVDHGSTSPHTGDNNLIVMALLLLGLGGVLFSVKKLSKSH